MFDLAYVFPILFVLAFAFAVYQRLEIWQLREQVRQQRAAEKSRPARSINKSKKSRRARGSDLLRPSAESPSPTGV